MSINPANCLYLPDSNAYYKLIEPRQKHLAVDRSTLI